MHTVTIIQVGKTKMPALQELLDDTTTSLKKYCSLRWVTVETSRAGTVEKMIAEETSRVVKLIPRDVPLLLLHVQGPPKTSEQFAELWKALVTPQGKLTVVIGGAYGIDVAQCSSFSPVLVSLSSMTFTHQLIRLMLLEQVFRAYSIMHGTPYHHVSSLSSL